MTRMFGNTAVPGDAPKAAERSWGAIFDPRDKRNGQPAHHIDQRKELTTQWSEPSLTPRLSELLAEKSIWATDGRIRVVSGEDRPAAGRVVRDLNQRIVDFWDLGAPQRLQ